MPNGLTELGAEIWGPSPHEAIRILVALVLGGAIGAERELRDKPAGFRTIILISVGACLFTILSQVVGGPENDATRIAAQIVSGVGFLGAGAIMRAPRNVFGLTTAATIWAVAAVGMAAGFGRISLAIVGGAVILMALGLFGAIEQLLGRQREVQEYRILVPNEDGVWDRVETLFKSMDLRVLYRSFYQEGSHLVIESRAVGSRQNHEKLRLRIVRTENFQLAKAH
ncbi:MAG: MgtC/SapB family protein [Planctomycetota bacterium]